MANQEQNLLQQEQLFIAAKQVSFNLEYIILNINNEVALLYPEHTDKEYFKCVSDFISKYCLRKPSTKYLNMYQEYLAEFWYSAKALENSKVSFSIPTGGIYGEVGLNTFRNAIGAYYLPHSSEYVPPSIDVVRKWLPTIGYEEEVSTKGTLRKSLLPPRWSLANGIHVDYANIFWEDIILKLKKKQREKVVPYTRFLSLLIMHKMKEDYGIDEVTLFPTQISSVNNWALKPNQPEEPPFTTHMLAICALDKLVVFKAPKTSSRAESVSQGAKPEAKTRHKKPATSSKQPSVSSKEAIKGGSSKAPTSSKTGHSKRRKESRSAMDSNPSRPLVSTPVDTEMHKEDQQATGGPTSLGSASGHDVSVDFTAEADPGLSAPNDFIRTDPHVLANQTKSVSEGLETVLTQPTTEKGASSTAIHGDKEEASNTIKSSQIQELTNQVLILQSQKHKLELEKNKAKAEAALLKAQPSFPNVEQLNELLWKIPKEFLSLPAKVKSSQAKLKTLDALPSLLLNVTKALNKFAEVLESTSTKLFQRRAEKIVEAEKENLNQQPKPTTPPTTTPINPPIITATTQLQNPLQTPPRSSSQPKGEHIKKDKGKKVMSSEEAKKESTKSNSDDEARVTRSVVTSFKLNKLKKVDFVTKYRRHIYLSEEQINNQNKLEEEAKAEAAK
ncbi:hypothetical protein Tco_0200650 [Tanacetum coccineum]